jgi:tRNA pseudouridine38-40 synthase
MRYRLTLEYDGTQFFGWQRQTNGPSVQASVEAAILAFSGEAVTVAAAGRTDTGVHARGQVIHFDLEREHSPDTVQGALNAHLRPDPISVLTVEEASPEFHARFDAIKRHYEYRILCRRGPPALDRNRVWWLAHALDVAAMNLAAGALLGNHDFTTFRAAGCQAKSPVKTLDEAVVEGTQTDVVCRFSARSFLHSQVRSMVGSLVLVGRGKWTSADLKAALDAADRTRCGPLAPPEGLTLMRVDYP